MGISLIAAVVVASANTGDLIPEKSVEAQNQTFQRLWGVRFDWKFDDLPRRSQVPDSRTPYSGYIYPDTAGGTVSALRKYDSAFHGGRSSATSHEYWDTTAFGERVVRRGGFGRGVTTVMYQTPHWHGHCNGWTAAAIRHAEPQRSVNVNGVVFTPADIKGLLAEIYIYNDTLSLAGDQGIVNPGELHAILANWLGRGGYPLGMEADPGHEKWNYPVYAYSIDSQKQGARDVAVRLKLTFAKDTRGEYHKSPRIQYVKHFHYALTLNNDGEIVGGYYYRDSSIIDLLWLPLRPKPSGEEGHERGNPHVDIDQVLAIWRTSVPETKRRDWFVADPAPQDRILLDELPWGRRLLPVQRIDGPEGGTALAVGAGSDNGESDNGESDNGESDNDESETGPEDETAVGE